MHILRFATQSFRNLADSQIFPCESVNVIYGENAQGKTNLLEGIWLFTGGHSFRGAKDSELPRLDQENNANAPGAALALDFFSEEREQKALLNIENGRRSSVINGVKKKTGSALVGKVCAVIFAPNHLLLVEEGPGKRRGFLDGALCQLKPGYVRLLATYRRALDQRNALIKDLSRYPELRDTLEVWDQRLAGLGAMVMEERAKYILRTKPKVKEIYSGISKGRETIDIQYSPSVKIDVENFDFEQVEKAFLGELKRTLQTDTRAGFTTTGPHRDDMEIMVDGKSARIYGSRGQKRSAVLALKLAEADNLTELTGETPIILLDDVMSELDQGRQDYLLNHLHDRQVFITCCSPETVGLMEKGKQFRVEAGKIFSEEI